MNVRCKDHYCTVITVIQFKYQYVTNIMSLQCLCIRPYGHWLQAVFAAGWHLPAFLHPLPSDESLIPTLDLIFWLTCKKSVLLSPPREPLMWKGAFSQLDHPFYIRSKHYHLCPPERTGPHSEEYQVIKGSNILICGIVVLPAAPQACLYVHIPKITSYVYTILRYYDDDDTDPDSRPFYRLHHRAIGHVLMVSPPTLKVAEAQRPYLFSDELFSLLACK